MLGPLKAVRDSAALSIESAHKPRLVLAALLTGRPDGAGRLADRRGVG